MLFRLLLQLCRLCSICTAITTWDTRKVSAVVSAEDPSAVFVLRCRVKVAPDVVSPAISAVLEAAAGADAEHATVHEGAALDAFRQAYGIEHFSLLKPIPFIDFHGALIQVSQGTERLRVLRRGSLAARHHGCEPTCGDHDLQVRDSPLNGLRSPSLAHLQSVW